MQPQIPVELENIVNRLHSAGARCLLAGGGVIDCVLGLEIKDWDMEIYNLSCQRLEDILSEFGSANLVGKSFGVVKLQINNIDYDFSIPRKDNRVGKGHRAFEIDLLPDLSPAEAARRRDITINSMYLDLNTREMIDPYGGQRDLREGRIRATDPDTFIEDPLRVMRIMQLLPRKGKFVDPDTIKLCAGMVDEFDTLPRERLYEEFRKLFLKAPRPSIGLRFLEDCGWIAKFPELDAMRGCRQNPEFHPEGDVWTHTLLTVDNAAAILNEIPVEWQMSFMLGMLCHDIGKPVVTDAVNLTAYGHEAAGVELTGRFLNRITEEIEVIDKVSRIVSAHMRPFALYKAGAQDGAWKRLHNLVPLHVIAYVTQADARGRGAESTLKPVPEFDLCMKYSAEFGRDIIRPVLMGRHLIAKGHKPGPEFSVLLDRAFQYQLDTGCADIEELYRAAIEYS